MAKYTQIIVVLDRSGSMELIKNDTIGGFNTFLEEQKKIKGKAKMSLILFDDQYEVVFVNKDIKEVKKLDDNTFVPRGWTALLDAVGKTINENHGLINSKKGKDKPEKVVFVIITDGQENNSKEYTKESVFKMINEMKTNENWKFMFLGANQDAINEAGQYGIDAGSSLTYSADSKGVQSSYNAMSDKISSYRSTGNLENFSDEDREKSMGNE